MEPTIRHRYFLSWSRAALAVAFMCASFSASASILLLYILVRHPSPDEHRLVITTSLKAVVFGALTVASFWGLWRRRSDLVVAAAAVQTSRLARGVGLILCLLVGGLAVLPRLGAYPWTAPDETHHLIVARNLAEHGLYASGGPTVGFRMFDAYDSVGAPVIVPIAAAFRCFGTDIASARVVIAIYYLLLCAGLYVLFVPMVGAGPASLGVVLATAGYGSIYLGRTLYGEVPALAYMVWGLVAWRRGAGPRGWLWSLLAGLAFGLAILCKTILILSAFAFLAVMVLDWLGPRRLRWAQIVAPTVMVPAVIGAWWAVQVFARHDVTETAGDTLGLYRHYLMFGLGSLGSACRRFAADPFMTVALVVALGSSLVFVQGRRYEPALAVLALLAVFFLFWWVCFTPCQIKRYAWWTYALAAMFGGRLAFWPAADRGNRRWLALGALLLFLLPPVPSAARELWLVYQGDEMRDDYALARYVKELPPEVRVMTTYWPLERSLNLLAERDVVLAVGGLPEAVPQKAILILDEKTQPEYCRQVRAPLSFGRYVVVTGGTLNLR